LKLFCTPVEQHRCSEYTIGEKISKYTIEKIIGRGGFFSLLCSFILLIGSFGAIYMVSDEETGVLMAVKCFFKGDEKVWKKIYLYIYTCMK
jgi:hypothetical protein